MATAAAVAVDAAVAAAGGAWKSARCTRQSVCVQMVMGGCEDIWFERCMLTSHVEESS